LRSSGVLGVTEFTLLMVVDREREDLGEAKPSTGSLKEVRLNGKSFVIRTWDGDRRLWILVVIPVKIRGTAPNIISAISSISPTCNQREKRETGEERGERGKRRTSTNQLEVLDISPWSGSGNTRTLSINMTGWNRSRGRHVRMGVRVRVMRRR